MTVLRISRSKLVGVRTARVTVPALVGSLALLIVACGGADGTSAATEDGRLQVETTVAPITSIVSAVGGDLVAVEGIVPEGTNSHTFEPPPSAAAVLAGADVLFVNVLELEEPTKDLAEANLLIDERGPTTVPIPTAPSWRSSSCR